MTDISNFKFTSTCQNGFRGCLKNPIEVNLLIYNNLFVIKKLKFPDFSYRLKP